MKKLDFWLQWVGTALTVLGAVLTSLNVYPWNVVAFNFGSIFWLLYAIRTKMPSLITVNAGLLLVYIFGVMKAAI